MIKMGRGQRYEGVFYNYCDIYYIGYFYKFFKLGESENVCAYFLRE